MKGKKTKTKRKLAFRIHNHRWPLHRCTSEGQKLLIQKLLSREWSLKWSLVDSAPGIDRDKCSEGPHVQVSPQILSPDKIPKNMNTQ